MASRRSISAIVSRASFSEVVSSTAGEVGPCSACPSRSVAQSSASTRLVGDDERLGRTGEEIDADAAEQLPLRFRHVGVAGANQHVDRPIRSVPMRHRADGLDAAEAIDLVRAGQMLRRDDRRARACP